MGRGSQRFLAVVVLHKRVERRAIAGQLWPDHPPERAAANLRAAIWRLPDHGHGVVRADAGCLAVHEDVDCDVHRLERAVVEVLDGAPTQLGCRHLAGLGEELLPAWDEEWLVLHREFFRQTRLEALDVLAAQLVEAGRCGEAVLVLMMAVRADPLRESARRLLVQAHEANGNRREARRQYDRYCTVMRREVGLEPSFGPPDSITSRDRALTMR